ncbi:pyruvate kinase [Flavivirga spongiicola]|uniref:pyruvate kinase n=1 Tax=Flavivirga spongiicola TaxID=421621 RepID=A0ABU7XVK8_9FLAO|nr:pyruvate kinase [Flavivirga sp. MEBiC05379]MDO5979548.1 pyruvate kinase [Flavivirga sp. MEBiC05379]
MNINANKIHELISRIETIIDILQKDLVSFESSLANVHPVYQKSARNLIHYNSIRKVDLRYLQKKLQNLGLSRLAKAEGHLMSSLVKTRFILYKLLDEQPPNTIKSGLSIKNGKRLLNKHSKELLGYRSKGRRVRIMVTQPTQAAYDYDMVYEMIGRGMNCARINCAHDGPEVWQKIINNIKKASKAYGKTIKITMDLAGPKIRTGHITPGPKIKKISPERDDSGKITNPAIIELVPIITEDSEYNSLPVSAEWLNKLEKDDTLFLKDSRDKHREFKVIEVSKNKTTVHCYETSYIETGALICCNRSNMLDANIGELPSIEQPILLKTNDVLIITKDDVLGNPAVYDDKGKLIENAHISCQTPEIFNRIKEGEIILFDDGKIEGLIETILKDRMEVRITRAKDAGSKLKAEKGMNFPTTNLGISGLTEKDKIDLEFVAKHADVVNFSFVNSKEDVEELLVELEKWTVTNPLSIILKIETRLAFDNLVEILLSAMKVKHIGVMIARGDLAVETGWENIGRIQEEILALCSAAHIPVVWATQVLENFAKKGLPSRSEITDAVYSLQAECIMLNKGSYMGDVLQLLTKILSSMEHYHEKNEIMLPKMEKA